MTRQIYETATAEVFSRAITAAPNWQEKELPPNLLPKKRAIAVDYTIF